MFLSRIDEEMEFSGCYATFCGSCFLASLADDISEPKNFGFCCGGSLLALYRMKVRTTLKIRVSQVDFDQI